MRTYLLKWQFYAPHGEAFRVARQNFMPTRPWYLHRHDYAEVFWVESGEGEHLVNGACEELKPGTLCMIRPEDTHEIRARSIQGLVFVNVSFPVSCLQFLSNRYFRGKMPFWSEKGKGPSCFHLTSQQVQELSVHAADLARSTRDRIHLETFLLNLMCDFLLPHQHRKTALLPDWLAKAVSHMQAEEHFSLGTDEFFRIAGRCPAHVSRTVKNFFKKTPTELINDIRMKYAAEQLALSSRSIKQIIETCGLS